MKHARYLLPGAVLIGILVLSGCGKKEEQPTRFNQTLGDSPLGVPPGPGSVDTSILQDQTAYKPATYEPLEGGAAGGGGLATGPEADAIRAVLKDLFAAGTRFDLVMALDLCVSEQVASLHEDPCGSTLYETQDTLRHFGAVFKNKAAGTELEPVVSAVEALPQLAGPFAAATSVAILDEENAIATFDPEKIEVPEAVQAKFEAAGQSLMGLLLGAMSGGMEGVPGAGTPEQPGGAPEPGPPGPTPLSEQPATPRAEAETPATPEMPEMPGMPAGDFSPQMLQQMISGFGGMGGVTPSAEATPRPLNLRLRKVDGEWRLVLPFTVREEHADVVNEGLLLVKDLAGDVTAKLDQVETLDPAMLMLIVSGASSRTAPAFIGWIARAQMTFGPALMVGEQEADTGGEEQPAEEQESAEPEEPGEPNAADEGPNAVPEPEPGREP